MNILKQITDSANKEICFFCKNKLPYNSDSDNYKCHKCKFYYTPSCKEIEEEIDDEYNVRMIHEKHFSFEYKNITLYYDYYDDSYEEYAELYFNNKRLLQDGLIYSDKIENLSAFYTYLDSVIKKEIFK